MSGVARFEHVLDGQLDVLASCSRWNEWRNIIAADAIAPQGLAMPCLRCPARSHAPAHTAPPPPIDADASIPTSR